MSCTKAIGIAGEMKVKYKNRLKVKIFTTDSEEAKAYRFISSTNVLFENEFVPIDIALDIEKMDSFLSMKLQGK